MFYDTWAYRSAKRYPIYEEASDYSMAYTNYARYVNCLGSYTADYEKCLARLKVSYGTVVFLTKK